ncbi:Lines protein [Spatholobus suberectus]|nr:Lines protein [Spatholobus suberectus]
MSPAGELRWLCRLLDDSLRPYTEPRASVSTSKEKEKAILIASSQVVTKIQLRIREFDSGAEVKRASDEKRLCGSNQHSSVDHCLRKIVSEMMVLLFVKSEFVQHAAVNALVLTSHFVSATGNNWDGFIHLLCCCLEMAIARMISCSSVPSSGTENSDFDCSDVEFLMLHGLKNFDWSTVAGIVRALRVICKYLKEEDNDDGLVKVYYDSVNSCLLKMPWDLLEEYWSREFGCMKDNSTINQLHLKSFSVMEPVKNFLGTFLQLLCSLVDRNDLEETDCDSVNKHPLFVTVVNLIPTLAKWCLSKQDDSSETCIIHYLKHKFLIMMIRLGSRTGLDCWTHLSWLELLHNYFQELLQQPLTQFHSVQIDCLEGSPFLLSLSDGEADRTHSCHLQRQAVYLLLACSFSLIHQRGENASHCNCSTLCSSITTNPDSEHDHFCRIKGSLELYKWIQGHLPTASSINHEKYLQICMNFMSSFLQLYLREDDLLFEVLLQLFSISSCLQQRSERKDAAYQDVMKDFPFKLSDIFNPVHLFHLFLSEIHYDHQVLLDYLISKDTGISCAKYLLRCLNLICNSWKLFVEFPLFGEVLNQSSCKRRKVVGDGLQFVADGIPTSVDNSGSIISHIKNYKEDKECGFKHYNIKPFKKAAECLLSLNNSVHNLHQKKLFPYNPEVLLKRIFPVRYLLYYILGPPSNPSNSRIVGYVFLVDAFLLVLGACIRALPNKHVMQQKTKRGKLRCLG